MEYQSFKQNNVLENEITIECNINKKKLDNMINYLLIDFCELDVYGYYKFSDEYWGKKIENDTCVLHVTLNILYNNIYSSIIKIQPIIGDKLEIYNLVNNINEAIKLYNNSKYIKSLFK
jgi:hypothetical protein